MTFNSIEELVAGFDRLEQDLKQSVPRLTIGYAMNAKALIQRRIQTSGKNAQGQSFSPYSTNKLPKFFVYGKASKAVDEKIKKNPKYKDGISYREFREEAGRQVNFVDLTFTGDMFNRLGIVSEQFSSDGIARVTIAGKDTLTQRKLERNAELRGEILANSRQEQAQLQEDFGKDVLEIFKRNGF